MAYRYKFTDSEAPVGRELYIVPTGDWRIRRPVIDDDKCRRCGMCTMYCPVGCISKTEDKDGGKGRYVIDLKYCKGCGICAEECPFKAIHFIDEEAGQK